MSIYSNPSGDLTSAMSQLRLVLNDVFTNTGTTITNFPKTPSWGYLYALLTSMRNLLFYTEAQIICYGINRLYDNLDQLASYPLALGTIDQEYLTNRLDAVQKAAGDLATHCSVEVSPATDLYKGHTIVSDPKLYEYLGGFNAEASPSTMTASGLVDAAKDNALGWGRIADDLTNSGITYPPSLLDTLSNMTDLTNRQVDFLSTYITTSAALTDQQLWNFALVQPLLLQLSSLFWNRVTDDSLQMLLLTKYALQKLILYCQEVLIEYRQLSSPSPKTAILHQGETLMDFAARTTGDYTEWTQIATLNNLSPPYVADTSRSGVATPGDRLVLPTPQASTQQSNYFYNTLGVDLNYGPVSGDLPQWNGDFQIMVGYDNLNAALIRRLLTPLGGYIYSTGYGSRLASMLGEPMTSTTIKMMNTYAKAALLSDNRVQSVLNINTTTTELGLAAVKATVQPVGTGATPTNLDLVLQPTPE